MSFSWSATGIDIHFKPKITFVWWNVMMKITFSFSRLYEWIFQVFQNGIILVNDFPRIPYWSQAHLNRTLLVLEKQGFWNSWTFLSWRDLYQIWESVLNLFHSVQSKPLVYLSRVLGHTHRPTGHYLNSTVQTCAKGEWIREVPPAFNKTAASCDRDPQRSVLYREDRL